MANEIPDIDARVASSTPALGFEEESAPFAHDDPETAPREAATGPQIIRRYWEHLPDKPGVYRMLDEKGEALYVGKARSLKKRVAAYTKLTGHNTRIMRMITGTASMVFIVTRTETEALLLEANLIKKLKPRYNILLRDDKSFPYILMEGGHDFPQLTRHRGARDARKGPVGRGGRLYGPFASAGSVRRTITQLQKAFLLRNCSDSIFDSRTRPCLQHQIKRCAAPCVGLVSKEEYAALVEEADAFLHGRSTRIQEDLAARMSEAAAAMDYERAAALRDRIKALTQVQAHQGVNPRGVNEADVIALHMEGGQSCVQAFFFRSGQNWGNKAYFPRMTSDADEDAVLDAFIGQFYATRPAPKLILLNHDIAKRALLAQALSEANGSKVEIAVPKRGEKRELVEHAQTNARESLARRMADAAAQSKLLQGVAEAFDLDAPPKRIEVYDNSHIQGSNAVGGMIVAGPEGYLKSQYRKFNIKNTDLTPGDDFGMMREVLTRRLSRLIKEDPDRESGSWPDVMLIDGGAGQLSASLDVFRELGIEDVALVSVAKGQERDAGKEIFHMEGRRPFALPFRDPTLYFLQRLRDEAHRFAIGAHRAKRSKAAIANPLDTVPGVGPARKRALLAHFGSGKAVSRAAEIDLCAVEGVSAALARRIYEHFNS